MSEKEFLRIVNFIEQRCGIILIDKRVLVKGRLEPYLMKNGFHSYTEYMDYVEQDITGKEVENLINILTTNHTYFMREKEHFIYLKDNVLPQLKIREENSKDIRIWCGAASTGEEPYTLAMIIHDFFGFEWKDWDTQILATDICTDALKIAMTGMYSKSHIAEIPEKWKKLYFRKKDDEYEVIQEIRDNILFRSFNLMSPFLFRKPLHVIFLRNVMIYFDKETKTELLNKVYDVLMPGGYLFIGATESINRSIIPFEYIQPSVYRKPL
ncbi:CheR family methyltransferase [Anaerosporobacter faecicola]|uniref:CheR family methyltransferase n=1 Tax=Anaerosporobacter faecicola TaxID=2718714 RepID=UPI00143964B2|nr:protein-glutamate O-methyltransferase CheR [Anaerosporobacter faecicola]